MHLLPSALSFPGNLTKNVANILRSGLQNPFLSLLCPVNVPRNDFRCSCRKCGSGLDPSTRGRCYCHLPALPEPPGFCYTAPWRTFPPHSAALTVSATFLASQNYHGTVNYSTHLPVRTVRRLTASLDLTAVSSVGGATVTQGALSTTAGPTRLVFSPVPPVVRTSPIPWPSRAT